MTDQTGTWCYLVTTRYSPVEHLTHGPADSDFLPRLPPPDLESLAM